VEADGGKPMNLTRPQHRSFIQHAAKSNCEPELADAALGTNGSFFEWFPVIHRLAMSP
jgi:hypothetical protein